MVVASAVALALALAVGYVVAAPGVGAMASVGGGQGGAPSRGLLGDDHGDDGVKAVGLLVPHSHWDAGWLKTLSDYFSDEVRAILDNVVAALSEPGGEERTFILSEAAFLAAWFGDDSVDEMTKRTLRELVGEGRVEIVGGGLVMADEALTTPYAHLAQWTVGHAALAAAGVPGRAKYGWQIDPFGASALTAGLLAGQGFEGLVINRIDASIKAAMVADGSLAFEWEYDDGKRLRTLVLYDHYSSPFGFDWEAETRVGHGPYVYEHNVKSVAKRLAQLVLSRARATGSGVVPIPWGNDFSWQDIDGFVQMDKILRYMAANPDNDPLLGSVRVEYATLTSVFAALDDRSPSAGYPLLAYWSGYYASRPVVKGLVRAAEERIAGVEALRAVAGCQAASSALDRARYNLGVMAHHDAITGTAAAYVVSDYVALLANATTAAGAAAVACLEKRTGPQHAITVFNPTAAARQWRISILVPAWVSGVAVGGEAAGVCQMSAVRGSEPADAHAIPHGWRSMMAGGGLEISAPRSYSLLNVSAPLGVEPGPGYRVVDVVVVVAGLRAEELVVTLEPSSGEPGMCTGARRKRVVTDGSSGVELVTGVVLTPRTASMWAGLGATVRVERAGTPTLDVVLMTYGHTDGGAYLMYDDYGLFLWIGMAIGWLTGSGVMSWWLLGDPLRFARFAASLKWGGVVWRVAQSLQHAPRSVNVAIGAVEGAVLAAVLALALEAYVPHWMEAGAGFGLGLLIGGMLRGSGTYLSSLVGLAAFGAGVAVLMLGLPASHGSTALGASLVEAMEVSVEHGPVVSRAFFGYSEHLELEWVVDEVTPELELTVHVLLTRPCELVARIKEVGHSRRRAGDDGLVTFDGLRFVERKRKAFSALGANFYPAVMGAALRETGLAAYTVQAMGVASLAPGMLELMVDRRLAHDDLRGLEEGLQDGVRSHVAIFLGDGAESDEAKWRARAWALNTRPLVVMGARTARLASTDGAPSLKRTTLFSLGHMPGTHDGTVLARFVVVDALATDDAVDAEVQAFLAAVLHLAGDATCVRSTLDGRLPPMSATSSPSTTALGLYRALLRSASSFSGYNVRSYAVRRVRDAFRASASEATSPEAKAAALAKGHEALAMMQRQNIVQNMYTKRKLVIEM
ncbi:uncharacterized protein AMSG_08714 [Thecamonas trahens ATCC 50062]|uniref:Glycoside hydrolase family 38 central domain-containing protein n=1 Tax=Thecamonas trahens ATCC 50062 TaxID=461836 RepID=A0A0L0DLP7_THETB|nr:hypothetical protein AMSG_08714 [Thecamonas trahens ATCC 50062]KNC53232.1 hypothetical protein AMSG_08714 [Thecamonas trahens ATCC 50062]|eukprot:XP_013754499.1 hypothetical protein AMSG_08714 [Thecamonas trahens ATCC 50062]